MAVGLRVERPPEHSAAAATPSPSTTQSYAGLRHRPEDVSARGVLLVKIQIIPAAQLGHVREGRGGRRHSTLGDSHGSQAHTGESGQHSEPAQPLTAFPHGNLISRALAAASSPEVPIDQRKDARTLKRGNLFRALSLGGEIGRAVRWPGIPAASKGRDPRGAPRTHAARAVPDTHTHTCAKTGAATHAGENAVSYVLRLYGRVHRQETACMQIRRELATSIGRCATSVGPVSAAFASRWWSRDRHPRNASFLFRAPTA